MFSFVFWTRRTKSMDRPRSYFGKLYCALGQCQKFCSSPRLVTLGKNPCPHFHEGGLLCVCLFLLKILLAHIYLFRNILWFSCSHQPWRWAISTSHFPPSIVQVSETTCINQTKVTLYIWKDSSVLTKTRLTVCASVMFSLLKKEFWLKNKILGCLSEMFSSAGQFVTRSCQTLIIS